MIEFEQNDCQAVYYPLVSAGILRLTGRDRLPFLQRQTTNNINQLSAETGQVSVLTNAAARILDVFFIFISPEGDESLFLLPLEGKADATARYLKSRIFFMDQVTLTNESPAYCQFIVDGCQAADALKRAGFTTLPMTDGIQHAELDGLPVFLIGWRGLNQPGPAFRLVAPAQSADNLQRVFQQSGMLSLDYDTREILRIESGLPAAASEISEEYTPLEIGLGYAVSDNKGCYTGQEIIARQITYDKITRQMVGLRLDQPVEQGSEVFAEDRSVGKVTSAALSPRLGPLALAVLKRPYFTPQTQVVVKQGEQTIRAQVVELPFSASD